MRKLLLMAVILLIPSFAFAGALSTLIEIARSQKEIAKDSRRETKNFEKVKKAIERKILTKGTSKKTIKRQYGEPVIGFDKKAGQKETWIYKSAASTFFEGEKIYLIFDDDGNLEEIKVVNQKK